MEFMIKYVIPASIAVALFTSIISMVHGFRNGYKNIIVNGFIGLLTFSIIGWWFYFILKPQYSSAIEGLKQSTNKELKIIVTKQAITKFATGILSKSSKIDSVLINKKGNGFVFTTEGNYYFRVEKKDTSLLVSKFVKTDMTEEERTLLLSESK